MDKKKYLVFDIKKVDKEVDTYDCYHSVDGYIAIPTEYIIELTDNEYFEIRRDIDLLVLPIINKNTMAERIRIATEEATKRAAKADERAKRAAIARAKKQEQEELKKLEELKAKYDS